MQPHSPRHWRFAIPDQPSCPASRTPASLHIVRRNRQSSMTQPDRVRVLERPPAACRAAASGNCTAAESHVDSSKSRQFSRRQLQTHRRMRACIDSRLGSRDQPLGNATLVAHYDYEVPSLVEQPDGFASPREETPSPPTASHTRLRSFTVEHSVAIEKGSFLHEISSAPLILK